jgi:hypothetical protein
MDVEEAIHFPTIGGFACFALLLNSPRDGNT